MKSDMIIHSESLGVLVLNIAIRAARAAANDILQAMDRIDRVDIQKKSAHEWVTSVDHRAEETMVRIIHEVYPEHGILTEERGAINPYNSEVIWIIDPLDGTLNFIHGIPHFAISIAVQMKGVTRYGVIYDPVRDELFVAEKGRGALLNQQRIRVSKEKQFSNALLATIFPTRDPSLLEKQTSLPSSYTRRLLASDDKVLLR
jgi:myo-inositol-1(or 4)-monophosphatase